MTRDQGTQGCNECIAVCANHSVKVFDPDLLQRVDNVGNERTPEIGTSGLGNISPGSTQAGARPSHQDHGVVDQIHKVVGRARLWRAER